MTATNMCSNFGGLKKENEIINVAYKHFDDLLPFNVLHTNYSTYLLLKYTHMPQNPTLLSSPMGGEQQGSRGTLLSSPMGGEQQGSRGTLLSSPMGGEQQGSRI